MDNRIGEFLENLPTEVRNVIDKVLEVELEKLDLGKPKGIKDQIKQIIHKEVKQRET